MKQKLPTLFLFLVITLTSFGQVANGPQVLEVCDDEANDETHTFNLTQLNASILGSQNPADFDLAYFLTQADADANIDPVPVFFTNFTNPQTIYARVTDFNTNNFDTTEVTLIINPSPVANQPTDLELCSNGNDGFEAFDLTIKNEEIIGPNANLVVSYYVTQIDAINDENPITNTTSYVNLTNPQTIFVRVGNAVTECFALTDFDIMVRELPLIEPIESLLTCDENNDGFALFDLTSKDEEIINEQNSVIVTYHETEQDANNGTNAILSPYTNSIAFSQTIYVSLSNVETGCFSVSSFTIEAIDCTDTDSDGVIDSDEDINENGNLDDDDTDNDDIPNYLDDDDDGDAIDTIDEIINTTGRNNTLHPFIDTDGDTIENYLDDDDDGDDVLTIDEDYNNNGDPTDDDTNMNSIPDYLESSVALSINNANLDDFSMYPNPAKGDVTIKLNLLHTNNLKFRVFDVNGKTISVSNSVSLDEINLNTSQLSSGLYFIEIKSGSNKLVQKLIKE